MLPELQMDNHLKEIRIDSTLAYDGYFLKVQRDTVRLPNGQPTTRESVSYTHLTLPTKA